MPRGPHWTSQEDILLLALVRLYQWRWIKYRPYLLRPGDRTEDSMRKRVFRVRSERAAEYTDAQISAVAMTITGPASNMTLSSTTGAPSLPTPKTGSRVRLPTAVISKIPESNGQTLSRPHQVRESGPTGADSNKNQSKRGRCEEPVDSPNGDKDKPPPKRRKTSMTLINPNISCPVTKRAGRGGGLVTPPNQRHSSRNSLTCHVSGPNPNQDGGSRPNWKSKRGRGQWPDLLSEDENDQTSMFLRASASTTVREQDFNAMNKKSKIATPEPALPTPYFRGHLPRRNTKQQREPTAGPSSTNKLLRPARRASKPARRLLPTSLAAITREA